MLETANHLILISTMLFLISMLLSAGAVRMGAPLLLVFLAVGMLAGEDGPGGIQFDDYQLTYTVGVVALAVILFDGGLRTNLSGLRVGLRPALSLATLGVLLTTAITGLFAMYLLNLSLAQGLLMGAIIGSTDAAAVFSLLQSGGIRLNGRVSAILELESGSNDPMAVFLTVALIQWLSLESSASQLPFLFIRQMVLGAAFGWYGGRLLAALLDRIHLDTGTYALLAMASGLFIFALTNSLGGSGFLAIYLTGIAINRLQIHALNSLRLSMDSLAWLAQVVMFLVLGLIATPEALLEIAPLGILLAVALIFIARPLAVWLSLLPFKIPNKEKWFTAWVGLRGAVPVVLALFPLLAGLSNAVTYFNIAFFVVLVSLIVQGWSTVPLARRLKLELPPLPEPLEMTELYGAPGHHAFAVTYQVAAGSRAEGLTLKQLPAPMAESIVRIGREQTLTKAQPGTALTAGEYVHVITDQDLANEMAEWFCPPSTTESNDSAVLGYFTLQPDTRLSDLSMAYGIQMNKHYRAETLAELFGEVYGAYLVEGDRVQLGGAEVIARRLSNDQLRQVGLRFIAD